jgi:hypothetical protein
MKEIKLKKKRNIDFITKQFFTSILSLNFQKSSIKNFRPFFLIFIHISIHVVIKFKEITTLLRTLFIE